jgi:hypothetical protein
MLQSLLGQRTKILIYGVGIEETQPIAPSERLASGLQVDLRRHPHRMAGRFYSTSPLHQVYLVDCSQVYVRKDEVILLFLEMLSLPVAMEDLAGTSLDRKHDSREGTSVRRIG